MTNPYYNDSGNPVDGQEGDAAVIAAEFTSIRQGFDKLPTLSGNGLKIVRVNTGGTALEAVDGSSALAGVVGFSGDITPSQITSNQNDYNPTGWSSAAVIRLSTDASRNITGLAGGSDGRLALLENVGSFNAVLKDEDAGSTAANRFALAADVTIPPDWCVMLKYDSTGSRWRMVGLQASAFIQTLLDDTTAVAARSTLGVAIANKGGILVGTGSNAIAEQAVGNDFFDLAANAAQTNGLEYRKPASALASGRNIAARTNASTPNSKIDITADEIVVRAANGGAMVLQSVSVTIDMAVSGANGLDNGTEASNTWYYGWVLAKPDGTVCGVASTSSSAPTLPSGYTMAALVTAVRNNGSSNFIDYRQRGNRVTFMGAQGVLTSGTATSSTSVSLSSFVPPNAELATVCPTNFGCDASAGGVADVTLTLQVVNTTDWIALRQYCNHGTSAGAVRQSFPPIDIPNESQTVYYKLGVASGSGQTTDMSVTGFTLPVGGQ